MGVSKITLNTENGEEVVVDFSNDTVTAGTLLYGETAHGADGEEIVGTLKPVLYTPQELTEEEKAQARENIGVTNTERTLLFNLFKKAAFAENASEEIASLKSLWGIKDKLFKTIKLGNSTGFVGGRGLVIYGGELASPNNYTRATLNPIGIYLKNGTTYKIGIGDAASGFNFGVLVLQANAPDLLFTPGANYSEISYASVTSKLADPGWRTADYTYTATRDNLILCVNFRNSSNTAMTQSDIEILLENFVFEEV